jgi:outer membrane lipoprotein-sorting protein
MKLPTKILAALFSALLFLGMSACDKGGAEKAGEAVDDAASDVSDAASDAADDISDGANDAVDAVNDKLDN